MSLVFVFGEFKSGIFADFLMLGLYSAKSEILLHGFIQFTGEFSGPFRGLQFFMFPSNIVFPTIDDIDEIFHLEFYHGFISIHGPISSIKFAILSDIFNDNIKSL